MSIVSEVKCPRCDRRYSGIRGRCPYCGARRMGRGKHSTGGENTRGKIIIGLLLMGVLVVAVVVLLVSSLGGDPENIGEVSSPPPVQTGENIDNVDGTGETPPETPTSPIETPTPPETPEPKVESVIITYAGSALAYGEFTCKISEKVQLGVKITPEGVDERIEWSSSDESICTVGPTTGLVTGLKRGTATLTVTVGDVTDTCLVRVPNELYSG